MLKMPYDKMYAYFALQKNCVQEHLMMSLT